MFALILNGQIASLHETAPASGDVRPVVDGTIPPVTSGSVIPRPVDQWTIQPAQVVRTWEEVFLTPAEIARRVAAKKKDDVQRLLLEALAAGQDPDFTPAGAPPCPLALKSQTGRAVQRLTPKTGNFLLINTLGQDELITCKHTLAIATATLVWPPDANSRLGQRVELNAKSAITTLSHTLNGNVLDTTATTVAAGATIAWEKTAPNEWTKVQTA